MSSATRDDADRMHHSCGCGCGEMTTVTNANEPCGCGCECCGDGPGKPRDKEIEELRSLRAAVERRLAELDAA
jgi:hypothetical protein